MISGLTAVPLEWGTQVLAEVAAPLGEPWSGWSAYAARVFAWANTYQCCSMEPIGWPSPCGIALAFVGPYRDPVRNRWVIDGDSGVVY